MSATYNIVTLDGKEHTGLDLFVVKQWYFSRRLRPDSFVQSPETGEWKLLKSLFSLEEWEAEERKVRGLSLDESVFKMATSPQQLRPAPAPQVVYNYDRSNELGLRTAAVLLFINAALNVVIWLLMTLGPSSTHVSGGWGVSVLLDVVVGVRLLSSGRWVMVTLGRVLLGALLGLVLLVFGPSELFKLWGLLEIVFASSFLLLLIGAPSRGRVIAGVAAFAISLLGLVAVVGLFELGGSVAKQQILKYAKADRTYNDRDSAVSLNLPTGWVMLPVDSPVAPAPDARMVAAHQIRRPGAGSVC